MDIKELSHVKTVVGSLANNASSNKADSSFSDLLKESISKVDEIQKDANLAMLEFSAKKGKSIHETMLAVEKADLSFRLMMQVRNKIIDAYQEVMRMAV